MKLLTLAAIIICAASCTITTPPPPLYILASQAKLEPAGAKPASPIHLNAVTIPGYLSDNAILVVQPDGLLRTVEGGVWASNFGTLLREALFQDLRTIMGSAGLSTTGRRLDVTLWNFAPDGDGAFIVSGEICCGSATKEVSFTLTDKKPGDLKSTVQLYQEATHRLAAEIVNFALKP